MKVRPEGKLEGKIEGIGEGIIALLQEKGTVGTICGEQLIRRRIKRYY